MLDVTKRRLAWRSAMAAAIAGFAVLAVAAGAQAHDQKRWKHRGPHFVPPGHVYYYSAPVIYSPRPVVYGPPVYYEPVYYPPPGLNLNFNVPLR